MSRFGLARGYHRLPALTAERFTVHPRRPGERAYRTGDLVRMVGPDLLEYLGRIDRQVKISGFRVEPGEVEAALLAIPFVEECVVIGSDRSTVEAASDAGRLSASAAGFPPPIRACHSTPRASAACAGRTTASRNARARYFKSMDELRAVFEQRARRRRSQYDVLMLYSGGKDSTYALCQLVEMGLSVYAFTLDNGFIADGAKANIRAVTARARRADRVCHHAGDECHLPRQPGAVLERL